MGLSIPHSRSDLDRAYCVYLCQHLKESCIVWHHFPKVYILTLPDFLNYPPWDGGREGETMTPWSSLRESAVDAGVSGRAADGVGRQALPLATALEMIWIAVSAEVVMEMDERPRG